MWMTYSPLQFQKYEKLQAWGFEDPEFKQVA